MTLTSATPYQAQQSNDRGDQSGSEQRGKEESKARNVGNGERIVSFASGAILAYLGLKQRSIPGLVMIGAGAMLVQRGATGHCGLYESMGVDTAHGGEPAAPEAYFNRGTHAAFAVTVNKSADELYRFWRDLTNLPKFMENLERVDVKDDKTSHWVVRGPAGKTVQWDAEIINDEPGKVIAWRSLGGADVDNSGSVRFVDTGDRGTEVHAVIDYIPPAGSVGAFVAKLFGKDAQGQLDTNLRRFKQVMEAGEIATTQGQPRGTCKGTGERQTGW
jgi:uncharacterized membrane protein